MRSAPRSPVSSCVAKSPRASCPTPWSLPCTTEAPHRTPTTKRMPRSSAAPRPPDLRCARVGQAEHVRCRLEVSRAPRSSAVRRSSCVRSARQRGHAPGLLHLRIENSVVPVRRSARALLPGAASELDRPGHPGSPASHAQRVDHEPPRSVSVEDATGELGRGAIMDRRGEGVPIILSETRALTEREPEYRLIDQTELLLTIWSAPPSGRRARA